MNTENISGEAFLSMLEARLDKVYTDEQKMLIMNMDKPTICFASPGTGKTTTAICGLLFTELYKHINGSNIYALSFTNPATAELAVRHKKACDALGLKTQTVTFKTLHSLCTQLLNENYHLLNMSSIDTSGSIPMSRAAELIVNMSQEHGEPITHQMAKSVVRACRSLNSALIFDEDHVKAKKCFKDTKLSYDLFTKLRKDLFTYAMVTEVIPVDNIILYALRLLTEHPEVSVEMKKKCKVMLVDEAQDLSLLHLRVISLMTECPILIGDMKQQIYAFNGACQEIVEQFYKSFPDSTTLELNQSFRCKNEIIDYANKIIRHNGLSGERVRGTGDGGSVQLINDLSLEDLASEFAKDYFVTNNRMFSRDTMFLFRNNASVVPIAEALYQNKVPFRVTKYQSAAELPVIKEMVDILNLCRNPFNYNYVGALSYLIPELRAFKTLPDLKSSSGSVFEVNYIFKDMATGGKVMMLLSDISEDIKRGATMQEIMNKLWGVYYQYWLKPREWMLENDVKYYTRIVAPLLRNKTFDKFVADESAKKNFINECEQKQEGIRCYTMHASKGLEADDVYIIDADEGLIPNLGKLEDLVKANCNMDAAREVRNERSLCYVAITRAKENVRIVFNGDMPASIILGENPFESLDEIYKTYHLSSDDITAFADFVEEVPV